MNQPTTLGDLLRIRGINRRQLLHYCAALATTLALPRVLAPTLAQGLERTRRPSVIWLSFQECTGCTESLTRAHAPPLESLILEAISLDYHHTLQAASGEAAERARKIAMQDNAGHYLVVVDGSVPLGNPGFSTIAGVSNVEMLQETVREAAAVIALGSCAAFGGLPAAQPNPTGATAIRQLVRDKPVVNIPGCPPIPSVIAGVVLHYLALGTLPELDSLHRPRAFYGDTIHDRCYRRAFYDQGLFAASFDDEGARKGWCLFKLGCKGPITHNACATLKWNGGVSFPIQSGHGCLGCSEPHFWDAGGFYKSVSAPTQPLAKSALTALATGVAIGGASSLLNRVQKKKAAHVRQPATPEDLEKVP